RAEGAEEHALQATLLGIGIAIILALVAALVGPYFVDWTQYRSVFEAQASRVVGVPVRIAGDIDVRILPVPWLVLHDLEVGHPGAAERVRASELSAELSPGPLMRGKLHASELRVIGTELAAGLDASGRIVWPAISPALDPDALSIDRLTVEDTRVTLADGQ